MKRGINIKLYIAHPIINREYVRSTLCPNIEALGIETLNPFYNRDGSYRAERPEVKLIDEGKLGDYEIKRASTCEDIVNRDLEKIRSCDGIVAYLPEASIGTAMEVFYCAKWCKKPVYILTTEKYSKHPWLNYLARISGGIVVKSKEILLEVLKNV